MMSFHFCLKQNKIKFLSCIFSKKFTFLPIFIRSRPFFFNAASAPAPPKKARLLQAPASQPCKNGFTLTHYDWTFSNLSMMATKTFCNIGFVCLKRLYFLYFILKIGCLLKISIIHNPILFSIILH